MFLLSGNMPTMLDICCSTFLTGKTSHKDVKDSTNWLFKAYYGNRMFMAYCCVSCEVPVDFILQFPLFLKCYLYLSLDPIFTSLQVLYIILFLIAKSQSSLVDVRAYFLQAHPISMVLLFRS